MFEIILYRAHVSVWECKRVCGRIADVSDMCARYAVRGHKFLILHVFYVLYLMETCDADLILYFLEYGAPDVGECKTQNVPSHKKLISILSKLTPYIFSLLYLLKK
jgi:hypothetical protein